MKSHRHAGNVNLRGRMTKTLSCGCCDAQNFKVRELAKIARREMRDETTDLKQRSQPGEAPAHFGR